MVVFTWILLIFLIVCAIAASLSKNLLNSIMIFMSYSLIMSVIWILLESPDLAITEAAVGAGVTSVLFFVTLKKIHAIMKEDNVAENSERKDNKVMNDKIEDSEIENNEIKDNKIMSGKIEESETENSKIRDSKTKDNKTKSNKTEDSKVENNRIQKSGTNANDGIKEKIYE